MRTHDHDTEEPSLRPKASRLEAGPSTPLWQAAAAGRADVLDPATVLGLQRAVGNGAVGAMLEEERSPVHDVVNSGGGTPLPAEVHEEMSSRLGHDFSDVRIHNDSRAHESAQAVNAHAYTVGSNVVFQRDRYDPSSADGKKMLAHELTHVVQQRSGPVDGAEAGGGIKVSDPDDRFEREAAATAETAMSAAPAPAAVASTGAAVQRHSDHEDVQREAPPEEEEESVQTSVQREEVPEEEEESVQTFVQREATPEEDEEVPM